jgi:hypothetical protein
MDKNDKLESGVTLEDALNTTIDFLEWFKLYLRENEPEATSSIHHIDDLINELPSDIDELCED